jgi:flagellar protein FlaJ
MTLLDPIVPMLGPLGPALAASDRLVVILGFIGLASLALYFVKKNIFETSKAWVGATVALSIVTLLFRGMGSLCSCDWFTDSAGAPTQLVPFTYLLIAGSFFAILYNFNIPLLKKWKWFASVPLSIPLALVSEMLFPLSASHPPWLYVEMVLLAPVGAIYSGFVYEKAVLHMGDYRARLRRFFEQTERSKKGAPELPPEKEGFIYFTYALLGRKIGKALGLFKSLKGTLSMGGMKVGYKAYVSLMVFSSMLGGGISFIVWLVLLTTGVGAALGFGWATSNFVFTFLTALVLSVLTGMFILGFFYMIPFFKLGGRRQRLDQFLPFTSSYMTVLASAGVTPERILRSTAEKDPKFMLSDEIANVVGRIDLLGYDVINALNAETERSPSSAYQDLLRGFAGVIRTGGDMKKFFHGITDHFFQKRALSVQSFIDTLGIVAETYVLMLIAFPLMLITMLSIMASIGGNLGGVGVMSLMYLMAFILIPICGILFLFLLDAMQPKG